MSALDRGLDSAFALVEKLGVPLAVAAWVTVAGGALAMGLVLRRRRPPGRALAVAAVVGVSGLFAHLLDYFVTLKITPDLQLEANPIWRIAIDAWGLPIAKAYAFTGKVFLSVLSFEFFAWYLAQREALFPKAAAGFLDFQRQFGAGRGARGTLGNVVNFFCFAFALFGPYFFYITYLNWVGVEDEQLYYSLPQPPVAISAYLVLVAGSYFVVNYRAFRALQPREPLTSSDPAA